MRELVWLTDTEEDYRGEGADPLLGHRQESWRWDILTLDGAPAGTLDGVEDASLEWSTGNTIRGGGSLSWAGTPEQEPDWSRVMLQPWYTAKTDGGEVTWPRGVFIPAAPVQAHTDGGSTASVELYDKLLILDQDKVQQTYTVPAGANIVDAVRWLIASAGQPRMAIEDSTQTTRSAMVWEAGTSKLAIVNDLLDSINYFALWCDGYGVYQGRPYQAPADRPVERVFVDDDESIYAPEFTHDLDLFSVPNKVIEIGRGDGETAALTSTATNEDPASPYSFQRRGRWIVHVDQDVEAANQATLDGIARRRLAELTQTASVVAFEHAHVPLELNDVLRFQRRDRGLDVTATVQSFSVPTAPGELMKTRIREVTT